MEYITSIVPETIATLGPANGAHIAGIAARQVGMHLFDETATILGGVTPGPAGFAEYMGRLGRGQGDNAVVSGGGTEWVIQQTTWRLMFERANLPSAVFDAWNELWVGAALAHDRWLRLEVSRRRDRGDPVWQWRITQRR